MIHRLYAGFLTDRHWTVVRNLKLRRGLLIVQLKASSILVKFIENDRKQVSRLMCLHSIRQHEAVASLNKILWILQPKLTTPKCPEIVS